MSRHFLFFSVPKYPQYQMSFTAEMSVLPNFPLLIFSLHKNVLPLRVRYVAKIFLQFFLVTYDKIFFYRITFL